MADLWSSVGNDIDTTQGEWLYQVGGQVRGPVLLQQLVDKLLAGEIAPETLAAKEGTDFHQIKTIKAFAPHLPKIRAAQMRRQARKMRQWVVASVLGVLCLTAGLAYMLHVEYERRVAKQLAQAQAQAKAQAQATAQLLAEQEQQAAQLAAKMQLVALVSLGSESDVKIAQVATKTKKRHLHTPDNKHRASPQAKEAQEQADSGSAEAEEMVQSCQLSQQQIFATLKAALGRINVCVEDEKKRDVQKLLPTSLEVFFVAQTDGHVAEFSIHDNHFHVGPMNNCLTKVFNNLVFAQTNGANCPITIPLKIAK